MYYNFPQIELGASSLTQISGVLESEFALMHATVAKMAGVWESGGSLSWQDAQRQMMQIQAEVNAALPDFARRIAEAGSTMQGADHAVGARFAH